MPVFIVIVIDVIISIIIFQLLWQAATNKSSLLLRVHCFLYYQSSQILGSQYTLSICQYKINVLRVATLILSPSLVAAIAVLIMAASKRKL